MAGSGGGDVKSDGRNQGEPGRVGQVGNGMETDEKGRIAQSRDLASAQRSRETPVTFNDIPISYASAATALRHLDEW